MESFMRAIVLTAMILALPVHAMAAPARATASPIVADKPVARIDSLIATSKAGRIIIQAKGAVTGGGWTHITLRPIKSTLPADAHTMVVEFVGVPPASNEAVIRGLLPVAASLTLKSRKGVVAVRAISDANEITTQILK
jgi:hypothetical protein